MHSRTISAAFRTLTAISAILALTFSIWSIWTVFTASASAPFLWRLQAALADAWVPCCLTIGFACATTRRQTVRRIGWGLVLLTLLVGIAIAWHIVAPTSIAHTITLFQTHSPFPTPIRLAVAIGATLALLDHATRAQRIEEAYQQYSESLFTYALSLSAREVAAAEDLVQDLFCFLSDGKHDTALQLGDEQLKAYLITSLNTLARTTARAQRRRARRDAQFLALSETTTPAADHAHADAELHARLDTAVEQLPPRTAEAFRLIYNLGLRSAEAATIMGISASTVRGYIKDALESLRPHFADITLPSANRTLQPEVA